VLSNNLRVPNECFTNNCIASFHLLLARGRLSQPSIYLLLVISLTIIYVIIPFHWIGHYSCYHTVSDTVDPVWWVQHHFYCFNLLKERKKKTYWKGWYDIGSTIIISKSNLSPGNRFRLQTDVSSHLLVILPLNQDVLTYFFCLYLLVLFVCSFSSLLTATSKT
jgi:hypothetical protein